MGPTLLGIIVFIVAAFFLIRFLKEIFVGKLISNLLSFAFLAVVIYLLIKVINFLN